MTVSFNIPEQAKETLQQAFGENLGCAAIEALAIEGYRSGKLSNYEVQTLLGLEDRWHTQSWLGQHGVNENYTLEDLEADRQTLDRVLGPENQ